MASAGAGGGGVRSGRARLGRLDPPENHKSPFALLTGILRFSGLKDLSQFGTVPWTVLERRLKDWLVLCVVGLGSVCVGMVERLVA